MATRFYFPSNTSADVTPTPDDWGYSAGAASPRALARTPSGSSMVTSATTNGNQAVAALICQYVSGPLAAGTMSGTNTLKGQFRCIESSTSYSCCVAINAYLVDSTGGNKRALTSGVQNSDLYTSSSHEMAGSLTNRKLEDVNESAAIAITNRTIADGDRLVIEVGQRASAAHASRTGGASLGDNSGTDLGENITDTNAYNPWVEFTWTFDALVPDGDITEALSPLASTAVGKETFAGNLTQALSPLASAASGTETFAGNLTQALEPLASEASGTASGAVPNGDITVALSALTATSSGLETFTGTAAVALSPLSPLSVGAETFAGNLTQALAPFAASGAGAETFSGNLTQALASFGSSLAGAETFSGNLTQELAPPAIAATGTYGAAPKPEGDITVALSALAAVLEGTAEGGAVEGAISASLAALASAMSGFTDVVGTATLAMRPLLPLSPEAALSSGQPMRQVNPRLPTPTTFPQWAHDLNRTLSAIVGRVNLRMDDILPVGGIRVAKKVADQTFSDATPAGVTDLIFPVAAGHYYYFRFICLVQSDTATVGIRMTVTVPGATCFGAKVSSIVAADGTAATFDGAVDSSGDSVVPTSVPATGTDYIQTVEGLIVPSATGNLQLQAGTETGTSNVIVRQGSVGILQDFGS